MYDVVIIGSGISGLYSAYKLQDKYSKIAVLEKSDTIGGRICTVKWYGSNIEAGAGRLNQTHRLYKSLLKELNIKTIPISGKISYYDEKSPYHQQNPFDYITKVLDSAKHKSVKLLQSTKFIDYAESVLKPDEIQFVKSAFGYYEQLVNMNTYNAIKLFSKGMHTKNHFSIVDGGMSSVINTLYNKLTKDRCTVFCNQEVSSIDYQDSCFYFTISNSRETIQAKRCIAAIPKEDLLSFTYCKPYKPLLLNINVKILCRIYAKFDRKDIWFDELPKTTVSNEIRYIIPIDREKGIIMISYTDSKYAKYWGSMPNKKVMIDTLHEKIQEALNITIAKPKDVCAFYWNTGTAYWKPNVDSRKISAKVLQPDTSREFYICGENYSESQGWIEGALETSNHVIRKMTH